MDIRYNHQMQKSNSNNTQFQSSEKPTKKYHYSGEIDSLRNTLKLTSEKVNFCDSGVVYYINKDGSGRKVFAWGVKNYPKGTFNSVLDKAYKISSEKQSYILSQDDVESLVMDTEDLINNL